MVLGVARAKQMLAPYLVTFGGLRDTRFAIRRTSETTSTGVYWKRSKDHEVLNGLNMVYLRRFLVHIQRSRPP